MSAFIIEDEIHCEYVAKFYNLPDAVAEIKRLSKLPWYEEPNLAPCISWEKCGREYVIIVPDDILNDTYEPKIIKALSISAEGVVLHLADKEL